MIEDFTISFEKSLTESLFKSGKSEIPIWYPVYNQAATKMICQMLGSKKIDEISFQDLLTHPDDDVVAECLKFLTKDVKNVNSILVNSVLERMSAEKNFDLLKMMIDACVQWYIRHTEVFQTDIVRTSNLLVYVLKKVDSKSAPLFSSAVRFAALIASSKEQVFLFFSNNLKHSYQVLLHHFCFCIKHLCSDHTRIQIKPMFYVWLFWI